MSAVGGEAFEYVDRQTLEVRLANAGTSKATLRVGKGATWAGALLWRVPGVLANSLTFL